MSDADILFQLIKESAIVPLQEEHGKFVVKLDESSAPDSCVTIRNLPRDALAIKADAFRSPDGIFNCAHGECRRADYVIISEEKKCILYIELKRDKDKWGHIVMQFAGTECFVKYCREIGKSFWNEKNFLKDYKNRFISIGHTSIPKKGTRVITRSSKHDVPEKAMKIDWPHYLQFNQIACLGE
jgi:hypothetical protein